MKKFVFIFLVTATALVACKDKKKEAAKENTTGEQKTASTGADPAKDTTEIKSVIIAFYNWYAKEYNQLMGYKLYSSIKKKDMPPYKINWDEVEKYQQFIRSSIPQLGEEFLKNQKQMLQQADSAFKVDTEDEIPYGFDYDWYTNSQEDAQYTVDEIKKAEWKIEANGETGVARLMHRVFDTEFNKNERETFLTISMKKENGSWKIARIGE